MKVQPFKSQRLMLNQIFIQKRIIEHCFLKKSIEIGIPLTFSGFYIKNMLKDNLFRLYRPPPPLELILRYQMWIFNKKFLI